MALSLHLIATPPRERRALVMGARAVQLVLEEEKSSQQTPHADVIYMPTSFFLGALVAFWLTLDQVRWFFSWSFWVLGLIMAVFSTVRMSTAISTGQRPTSAITASITAR